MNIRHYRHAYFRWCWIFLGGFEVRILPSLYFLLFSFFFSLSQPSFLYPLFSPSSPSLPASYCNFHSVALPFSLHPSQFFSKDLKATDDSLTKEKMKSIFGKGKARKDGTESLVKGLPPVRELQTNIGDWVTLPYILYAFIFFLFSSFFSLPFILLLSASDTNLCTNAYLYACTLLLSHTHRNAAEIHRIFC